MTDLVSGMAAALEADVMVGLHGANLANVEWGLGRRGRERGAEATVRPPLPPFLAHAGWLMRPGASVIEIQPFGFDAHPPHLQDPVFNAMARRRRLQCLFVASEVLA